MDTAGMRVKLHRVHPIRVLMMECVARMEVHICVRVKADITVAIVRARAAHRIRVKTMGFATFCLTVTVVRVHPVIQE